MRRHRFLVEALPEPGATLEISGPENEHLARVLRLRAGQPVFVFDGKGNEAGAVLVEVGRSASRVSVGQVLTDVVDSPLRTVLVQSLAAGDRVDQAVRRGTELGVSRVVLLHAARVDSTGERLRPGQLARWRRIAEEAGKQCGRRVIPDIEGPVPPSSWPPLPGGGTGFVLDPDAEPSLAGLLASTPRPTAVAIAVGPEGGWSAAERDAAARAGYVAVRLGPRVLRTEVAGPAALALVQAAWGDLA